MTSLSVLFRRRMPAVIEVRIEVTPQLCIPEIEGLPTGAISAVFSAYDASSPDGGRVEYFPARRFVHSELWREHPGDLERVRDASLRVSKDIGKFGFIRAWCFDLVVAEGMQMQELLSREGMVVPSEELDLFVPFKRALEALSDTIRLKHVEAKRGGHTLVWFARRGGGDVELAHLSDSEVQAVIFAATFCRQRLRNSLVLIDRPFAGIHPDRHEAFLRGILGIGDGNQIIATMHDRALAEALGAHVIAL